MLGEIVTGVKKVTDVVAEIAASSREQASGIEQVNKAVTSMDEMTQQNAALVEEASAAAHALTEQASSLTQIVERYAVGHEAQASAPPVSRAGAAVRKHAEKAPPAGERRSANRPWSGKPAARATAPPASDHVRSAGGDDEWESF